MPKLTPCRVKLLLAVVAVLPTGFDPLQSAMAQSPRAASSPAVQQAYAAAAAFQNEGVFELAVEEWEAFLKRFANDPLAADARFNLAACYFKLGKFNRAAAAYETIATKHPRFGRMETTLFNLGIAHYRAAEIDGQRRRDRLNQAARAFDELIKKFPNSAHVPTALFLQAECLFRQGKYAVALPQFSEALRGASLTDDNRLLALLRAGQCAARLQRWEESLKFYERLTAEHSQSAYGDEATFEQGRALQNLGRSAEALQRYEAVMGRSASPLAAQAQFMIGRLHAAQGEHRQAVRAFYKVIHGYGGVKAAKPYQAWQAGALYEAARSFEMLNNVEQAKKLYRELLQRHPNSDVAPQVKQRLAVLKRQQ